MGSQFVELKHLPHYMITESKLKKTAVDHNHDIFASLNAKESIVLRMFFEAFKRKKKIGRRQISDQAFDKNVSLSENDVRVILKHLKELGYIEVNLGRGGSNITQKGIELIEEKSVK